MQLARQQQAPISTEVCAPDPVERSRSVTNYLIAVGYYLSNGRASSEQF
ncbi:MAG TPA: hypothetical protein VEF04_09070 [Blastocatellia bacterium]|nr:hypothetical protein [Blastocatellia bacterium]